MTLRLLLLADVVALIVGGLLLSAGITDSDRGLIFFGVLLLLGAVLNLGTRRFRQRLRAAKGDRSRARLH